MCFGINKSPPCHIYINPFGTKFNNKVLAVIGKRNKKLQLKIVDYLYNGKMDKYGILPLNSYLRRKIDQSLMMDICYCLHIYTKYKPYTFLVLTPKQKNKKVPKVRGRSQSISDASSPLKIRLNSQSLKYKSPIGLKK
uniref:Uncharacterized protein n=1 Tax=Strongyloides stercoralis TaxID=6248 RepID=A0A0K0EPE3_STRER